MHSRIRRALLDRPIECDGRKVLCREYVWYGTEEQESKSSIQNMDIVMRRKQRDKQAYHA